LRNYMFFDAPCAFIVCMERSLAQVDVLSIGMYLQALCLLLAEEGIATCVEVSVAGYPQVRNLSHHLHGYRYIRTASTDMTRLLRRSWGWVKTW
jgi:hypothetical protein